MVKAKNNEQALKKLRRAPAKLEILLDLANLIPPEREPIDFSRELAAVKDYSQWWDVAEKALEPCLEGLPALRKYIYGGASEMSRTEAIEEAVQRYIYLHEIIKLLRSIVRLSKMYPQSGFSISITRPLNIQIDAQGTINVGKDFIAEALDEVEAERIRECEICNRIFWAGRITIKCCSLKHANLYRVRKSQSAAAKQAYKARRYEREIERERQSKKPTATKKRR
ncbi:MAG: hypothetical protein H0T60_14250 [Acidobacteria bacterium]|nr:hypothetical protein [Acidobacteriota bacterium]